MGRDVKPKSQVVTAYAQSASGPGWGNSPVWVIVRDLDGTLREECIQPSEQTAEIQLLYPFSQIAHGAMVKAIERARRGK